MPVVRYDVHPVVWVESALTELDTAPTRATRTPPTLVLVFDVASLRPRTTSASATSSSCSRGSTGLVVTS